MKKAALATSVYNKDICCRADAKNKKKPIDIDKYKNFFLFILNIFLNFLISKIIKKGTKAKNPTKNLVELNIKGPILSMPVSWAINVVPQINVQSNALINDKDLDIC